MGLGGVLRRQFSERKSSFPSARSIYIGGNAYDCRHSFSFGEQLATRSIEPSFGLLFADLLTELKVETLGAAVIMSTYDVMMNFSGLFVGPLLKEFSYRKVAIFGALLCSLGLALTSPAQNMAHILTTFSIINGKHFITSLCCKQAEQETKNQLIQHRSIAIKVK